MINPDWLPIIFLGLMALAVIVYAILDGYDLGVGILLPLEESQEAHRDTMIASIGPFWDANETWLVLAIGLMLIAFPAANSLVMYHLYMPVAIMLIGLIMRGVAFDFRAKAAIDHKLAWDRTFKAGSIITTLTQGYMLGMYVMGFEQGVNAQLFALLSAIGVSAAYSYIGGAWLIFKTEGELQRKAVEWTRKAGRFSLVGVLSVSIINPIVNPGVFERWFEFPLVIFTPIIPVLCIAAFIINDRLLANMPKVNDRHCWLPLILVVAVFLLSFSGLAFSFFPDVVPGRLTIWEAASSPEALTVILYGALVVVPIILLYTAYAYYVFHGKATELNYH